jgi:CMP-N,N'-diacetyllegionaminic acid synthase
MIDGLSVLAMIPARGGSKRIPGKNLAMVEGQSLLSWTSESAKKSRYIDRLFLSSEDSNIIAEAKNIGLDVPFVRPTELSQDHTSGTDPIVHALSQLKGYDLFILLQATSPLRTAEHIDSCLEMFLKPEISSVASVAKLRKKAEWLFHLDDTDSHSILHPAFTATTQELFCLNGAMYAFRIERFLATGRLIDDQTRAYVMSDEASLDIDYPEDLETFRRLAPTLSKT